jgi:A/G-specific adenine glycosylase
VLRAWRGLGYPRRARRLHETAAQIVEHHGGRVPSDPLALRALPGVGPYTAAAVASFAFGRRVAVLDTNVGRVLARAAANRRLAPAEARELAQALLGRSDPRIFNQAVIDLGAQFCRARPLCGACPVARACRWRLAGAPEDPAARSAAVSRPQGAFAGSLREARGRVLATLEDGPSARARLQGVVGPGHDVTRVLDTLAADGLVETRRGVWALARGRSQ